MKNKITVFYDFNIFSNNITLFLPFNLFHNLMDKLHHIKYLRLDFYLDSENDNLRM